MRRILVSMALACMASFSMVAQDYIFNNPANEGYFGIRVAGEVTCPGDISSDGVDMSFFKNGGGIEFGGIYNAPIVANFYIEPGLKFYYNTYSMKDDIIDIVEDGSKIMSVKYNKFGMRIPVMFGYHFDFTRDVKVSVFTGPELEIGFSAKEKIDGRGTDVSNDLYGDDGSMNRVDLLWGVGAGVTYQHIFFSVSGNLGMLNMLKDSDPLKFHENRVSFTLGYNF